MGSSHAYRTSNNQKASPPGGWSNYKNLGSRSHIPKGIAMKMHLHYQDGLVVSVNAVMIIWLQKPGDCLHD